MLLFFQTVLFWCGVFLYVFTLYFESWGISFSFGFFGCPVLVSYLLFFIITADEIVFSFVVCCFSEISKQSQKSRFWDFSLSSSLKNLNCSLIVFLNAELSGNRSETYWFKICAIHARFHLALPSIGPSQ